MLWGFFGLCSIFVHEKGLQSKKGLVHTKGSYSPPQETLLLSPRKLCASLCNRCIHSSQSADYCH